MTAPTTRELLARLADEVANLGRVAALPFTTEARSDIAPLAREGEAKGLGGDTRPNAEEGMTSTAAPEPAPSPAPDADVAAVRDIASRLHEIWVGVPVGGDAFHDMAAWVAARLADAEREREKTMHAYKAAAYDLAAARESEKMRFQWLDRMKESAGYHPNVSFDAVWERVVQRLAAYDALARRAKAWKPSPYHSDDCAYDIASDLAALAPEADA